MKFARDRFRWLHWLFEARKRYALVILDYMATSNDIHLLVADNGSHNAIPKSMQLVAGRLGQEFNKRKNRKGAFWEDRYHATAIETDQHLFQCIAYMDLNMVRAGVVSHPSDWNCTGYNEIQNPKQRYGLIDFQRLMDLLQIDGVEDLKSAHRGWVEESLRMKPPVREDKWTQSIAVGSEAFIKDTKSELGLRAKYRKIDQAGMSYQLREKQNSYNSNFAPENEVLSAENMYFWNGIANNSNS